MARKRLVGLSCIDRRAWAARSPLRRGPWARGARTPADGGSVTPLVLGMVACLLFLGAGVTAAGSAFLAGQRLSHLCDGAVAAAADAVDPQRAPGVAVPTADPIAAANRYLAARAPGVSAVVRAAPTTISAICTTQAPITFGALFGVRTLHRQVTATSRPLYETRTAA